MNTTSRTITGIITIILGFFLVGIPFFDSSKGTFFIWIYGIPILIIGFYILFNTKEDKIERRKDK
jgi:membrane protein DedA with SNARE-associated domain